MQQDIEYLFTQFVPWAKAAFPRSRVVPLTKQAAGDLFDAEIRKIMTERKVTYSQALAIYQKDKPQVVEAYNAIMKGNGE